MKHLFLAVAAFLFAASPVSSRTYLGPDGGTGGSKFTAICSEGEVLVGLAVQVNNALRVVAPICAVGISPFQVSEETVHVYEVVYGTVQAPGRYMRCPSGRPVIRAMAVWEHPDLHLVDKIHLNCGPVSTGAPPVAVSEDPDLRWDGGDFQFGSQFTTLWACPYGEVGVGIHGRSGASVDALGLVCDVPVLKKTDWSKSASPDAKSVLEGQRAGTEDSKWKEPGTSAAGAFGPPKSVGTATNPTPVVITLNVSATQTPGKVDYDVKLTWSGATAANVDIYRNGTPLTSTANDGEFVESLRNGTYTFRVCNAGSTSECSSDKAVTF